jgi:hypothetical protein
VVKQPELKETPLPGLWKVKDGSTAHIFASIRLGSDVDGLSIIGLRAFDCPAGARAAINAQALVPSAASAYRMDFIALLYRQDLGYRSCIDGDGGRSKIKNGIETSRQKMKVA